MFSVLRQKKGEDLATKEDIAGITKEIESVKDSYNKSLEEHKIELQKEFESYKYINELCNSIDKELLRKLVTCKGKWKMILEYIETTMIMVLANHQSNHYMIT